MAWFDVVVPCYNYGSYLEGCVASVLDQEGVDARVLMIDDCSSDYSAMVGRRLAEADQRIQFRRHETNQGHISTYNEGLRG
jgi:glycosyltransferase involved in cell wall biosynthesis